MRGVVAVLHPDGVKLQMTGLQGLRRLFSPRERWKMCNRPPRLPPACQAMFKGFLSFLAKGKLWNIDVSKDKMGRDIAELFKVNSWQSPAKQLQIS